MNISINSFVCQHALQFYFSEEISGFVLAEVPGIWNYGIISLVEINIFLLTSVKLGFLDGKEKAAESL